MQTLEKEVLLTLSYSAQFSFPLTLEEIFFRRINLFRHANDRVYTTKRAVTAAIENLISLGLVVKHGTYFSLASHQADVQLRRHRAVTTAQKIADLQPLIRLIHYLPGVAGLAITGSAAVINADQDDDIDLLVVTENNRLWLVRPLLIFFAYLSGKRRTWQHEEKNSWCFNLWLEQRSLQQPQSTHSLYVAYEVCQTHWLINNNGCMVHFYALNRWVAQYIPEYFRQAQQQLLPNTKNRFWPIPIVDQLLTVANYGAYLLQRWYMRGHMTRERVTLSAAFFHPRDTRSLISSKLKGIIRKIAA